MTEFWGGLMRQFILGFGISPAEFWQLSAREAEALLKISGAGTSVPSREGLEQLSKRYPDTTPQAGPPK